MKMQKRILVPGQPNPSKWSVVPCSYCGMPGIVGRVLFNEREVKLCQIDTWLLEYDPGFLDLLEARLGHGA